MNICQLLRFAILHLLSHNEDPSRVDTVLVHILCPYSNVLYDVLRIGKRSR